MAAATGTNSFMNPETGETYYMPPEFGGGSLGGFNSGEVRGFGGAESGGFGEAQGRTSNYQGMETPFNPNVGAPSWLKDILGVASVIPSPIQPIAALANVATNLYDANARGTSLVPSLSGIASLAGQPVLAAGLGAYGQYEQGNTIGAGLTGLGALGIATGRPELGQLAGQVGSGLNAYNAAERGDYLTAALSATGAVDPSLAREANAANAINQGLQTGNVTAVLQGAAGLTRSPDLNIAAQGSKLIDAAAKNDWGTISDVASSFKQGASDLFAGAGSIRDLGNIFAQGPSYDPGELDRIQMAVGPRDEVGYVPDSRLIRDYVSSGDGGGGGGRTTAAPSPAPVATAPATQAPAVQPAPAQDNSDLMAVLLAMGLMDNSGQQAPMQQTPIAAAPMPAFDVNSMFLSSYLGDKNRQPRTVAELLQSLRTA